MKTIGKVQSLQYTLFRRKNCRNVTIRVIGDGSIRVSAPFRVSVRTIEQVIEKNLVKLKVTVENQQQQNLAYIHTWDNGDHFLFEGKPCLLSLQPSNEDSVDFENDIFKICYCGNKPTKEEVCRELKELYRGYAKARLAVLVLQWAQTLSLDPPPFSVRDSLRRWGSCSARGVLSFSLRSASLDAEVLSYLVLHEMAHLVYFNHGREFHALLGKYMPNWKMHQKHMFSLQRQSELTI